MKNDSFTRIHISGSWAAGLLMMLAGLSMMFWFGIAGVRDGETRSLSETGSETSEVYDAEAEMNASAEVLDDRIDGLWRLPMVFLGGVLVLGGVPLFYAPLAERSRRRRRLRDEEDETADREFDYPDDEFDFILNDKVRAQLLEQKRQNIQEKRRRKRRY